MFLSHSFSLPFSLSKNKSIKSLKKMKHLSFVGFIWMSDKWGKHGFMSDFGWRFILQNGRNLYLITSSNI